MAKPFYTARAMRFPTFIPLAVIITFSLAAFSAEPPPDPGKNAVLLFDGKTLAGWEGNPKIWRVEDGALTGGSLTETVKVNEFLATTKDYANFVIRFKIKLTGTEGFINSGFQIRSQRVPDNTEMIGYQCDFGEPDWYGSIYDESRRNRVIAKSDFAKLDPAIKRNDWNDYVIRADGARVTTWINGVQGVDFTEPDPNIIQKGKFGIQVHGGGKALVQVKDVVIDELPDTPQRQGAPEPAKPTKESPLSPAEEHAAFSVAPGLEMELVVEEDIEQGFGKFVAVQFDQRGRLWTMTALEYPVDGNENPGAAEALYASKAKDKILVYDLEHRGGDGQPVRYAKKPTVFADGLAIPLGILPYKDGCYVQHGHDLALLRDTDGDGRADTREVILTGFGVQDSHLFPHQFTRAPGGWIWMAQGAFNYSNVVGPDTKEPVKFDQTRMAKFRPDGREFTITSNGPCNIWGLVINGEGEAFIQEANDFGYPVMPFHEYANYPGCSNGQWKSYAPEFPATAPGFRMGGTGLSGLALTDVSGAFPPEWSDVMLVANPITNRIQAIKMHRDATTGTGWRLEKLPDVVISGDPWFRPVGLTLGPDGAVYIVDWYNKIISHNEVPRNHPERDKKRGRIWRLKGKAEKGFAVPDFTAMAEGDLAGKFGNESLAQSQLAFQALEDKPTILQETLQKLEKLELNMNQLPSSGNSPVPYPNAARIQILWANARRLSTARLQELMSDPSRNIRREVVRMVPVIQRGSLEIIEIGLKDSDAEVRAEAIRAAAFFLGLDSAVTPVAQSKYLSLLLAAGSEPLSEPTAPSTQSGKPIKVGAAYEREFERYLVRMFLEKESEAVSVFLDSEEANNLPAENLMLASLSLPPKASAPRVAKLLPQLQRAPNDEEILRLAEAPGDPAVQAALGALIATPAGLEALLRQQAKFDATALEPPLTGAARRLLAENENFALRVISAFKLLKLEPEVAALVGAPQSSAARNAPPHPGTPEPQRSAASRAEALRTLRDLGSTRAELFVPLARQTAEPAVHDAALACLAATPDALLPLWPEMNAAQRRRSLDSLASSPAGATALTAALNDARIAKDELDGPLVDKLQAVLKDDAGLKTLLDSMTGLFAEVLHLNGDNGAWVDARLTLDGPFTVETWIKLAEGIGNADGILGAPGVVDINFYDARLRVWAAGLHDVIVAQKQVTPGAWTHVAVTRDAAGNFRLYLNGELDQAAGTPDPRRYEGLAIGRTNVPQGTDAQLAECRVWNACRSADDIRALFDRTALAADPALIYYRPLNAPWDALHGPARVVKTMDFPPLVTPAAAQALDEKIAHYRALAEAPGGDPARGKVAAASCLACHKIGAEGGEIGPNLSAVGAMGTEAILRNILTPNAAMEPGYRLYRVELADGSLKEGFLAREEPDAIVLRLPGVEDERIALDRVRKSGFVHRSLMPEGLEATYTPQQWADLFAYLKTLR